MRRSIDALTGKNSKYPLLLYIRGGLKMHYEVKTVNVHHISTYVEVYSING